MKKIKMKKVEQALVEATDTLQEALDNVLKRDAKPHMIFGLWNRVAEEYGFTKCSFFSDDIKRAIIRDKQYFTPKKWRTCFKKLGKASFLHGRKFVTLSWFLKPDNFTKILDGAYDEEPQKLPKNAVGTQASVTSMLNAWRKKRKEQ